ncbi:FAS-associated death domain protein-like [Anneissia japonica]|uniref:FAS-associated death domain protein-like n=1 Tax=Anneissia japonica TaxID=1529436 RepID=UPI0014258DC1|nr:FAS-associated death domain protein-like [Anneissia japonica]
MATTASFYDPDGILCDRKLISISTMIGQQYPQLGRQLGLSESQIADVKAKFPDNMQHQIFHMLALWREQHRTDATMTSLLNSVKRLGWISVYTQIINTPDNFYVVL